MEITPDNIVYWQRGIVEINATLVFSWVAMVILTVVSWAVTRNLDAGTDISRWQNMLEVTVSAIRDQIREAAQQEPDRYLPFIGTLFLFIVLGNVLDVIPGFVAPTASLSSTGALAACVFVAVPIFGIQRRGVVGYFRQYIQPNVFMLPFNIIGELSRTLALAVRLFGNITSGALIIAILISLTPLFFPIVMQLFGILIGVIQAYVFAMLALVYIASATRVQGDERGEVSQESNSANQS
jgi:F-type H+-transporting ATPase subunit a